MRAIMPDYRRTTMDRNPDRNRGVGNVLLFEQYLTKHDDGHYSIDASAAGIPPGGSYPHTVTVPELNWDLRSAFHFMGFDEHHTARYQQESGKRLILKIWND
jgi:hypothetical protein